MSQVVVLVLFVDGFLLLLFLGGGGRGGDNQGLMVTLAATKTKRINTGKVLLFHLEFLGGNFTIGIGTKWP